MKMNLVIILKQLQQLCIMWSIVNQLSYDEFIHIQPKYFSIQSNFVFKKFETQSTPAPLYRYVDNCIVFFNMTLVCSSFFVLALSFLFGPFIFAIGPFIVVFGP